MNNKKFNCIQCGACCMSMGKMRHDIEQAKKHGPLLPKFYIIETLLDEFPYHLDDKGICEKLVKMDNGLYKCDVYDFRPLICNIDKMHGVWRKEAPTKAEYYHMTEKACRYLMQAVLKLDKNKISLLYEDYRDTIRN